MNTIVIVTGAEFIEGKLINYVSTKSAYKHKMIPFGHKYKQQEIVEERNESYYFDHADGSFI
jgi:hypothetical protein